MENKNKLNKIHLLLLCTIFLVLFCNIYSYGYGHGRGGYGGRGGHQKKEVIEKKDLYKILDLTRRAGKDDIKKNYRKLTREYHPDRNPDFREKFQDISEAYEILSDRKKRRIYDLKGYHGYKESVKNEGQNNQHQMMGGMFGMMGGQQKDKLEDLNIKLKVSLADLYNGKELNFKYTRNTICPHCRGTGGESEDDVAPCKKCSGSGWTMETHQIAPGYVQQFQKPCPKCAGKGQIITTQCHICGGVKLHPSIEEMSVFVEKGMKNGQKITFEEAGDESVEKNPGDLNFLISEGKDNVFTRDGNHLRVDLEVTLKEALLGFEKTITHLDDRIVKVERDGVTQPGTVIKFVEEGMPIHDKHGESGDLFVTIKVLFPVNLTEKQKKIADELFSKRSNW